MNMAFHLTNHQELVEPLRGIYILFSSSYKSGPQATHNRA